MDGFILFVLIVGGFFLYRKFDTSADVVEKENKVKRSGRVTTQNQPNEYAVRLANQFTDTFFNKYDQNRVNDLAEDMIEMAGDCWARYDFESYRYLLKAAEKTSYMYSGNKYPHDLVEELIRKQKS